MPSKQRFNSGPGKELFLMSSLEGSTSADVTVCDIISQTFPLVFFFFFLLFLVEWVNR